jgi:hypothetical protein
MLPTVIQRTRVAHAASVVNATSDASAMLVARIHRHPLSAPGLKGHKKSVDA